MKGRLCAVASTNVDEQSDEQHILQHAPTPEDLSLFLLSVSFGSHLDVLSNWILSAQFRDVVELIQ